MDATSGTPKQPVLRKDALAHVLKTILPKSRSYASLEFKGGAEEGFTSFSYHARYKEFGLVSRTQSAWRQPLCKLDSCLRSVDLPIGEQFVSLIILENLDRFEKIMRSHHGIRYGVSFNRNALGCEVSSTLRFSGTHDDTMTIASSVGWFGSWESAYNKVCDKIENYPMDYFG